MLNLDEFETDFTNHGGGDNNMMRDLHKYFNGEKIEKLSLISESVESHKMAFAAEKSRNQNGMPVNI
jgi:hypothetical protein